MEGLSGKKALIILTNEAFLPKSGRGGRRNPRYPESDGTPMQIPENGPVVQWSPWSWNAPQPTIQDPPRTYSDIASTEETFTRAHERTGVDLYELGYLWMKLKRQYRMELVFATPRGGPVAADPVSVERMEKDSNLKDSLKEELDFVSRLGHTFPISWIKPEEFKLVILLGGHGALYDLPEHEDVACAVTEIYRRNGVVAAIGHGVAGLLNVKGERRSGEALIKNKRVCCFSREEEKQMGFEQYIPYVLEERLKEKGAKVENKKAFEPNTIVEERIITAQNPQSIQEFINKISEQMKRV